MKSIFSFITFTFFVYALTAQSHSCGFDHVMDEIKKDDVIKSKIYNNDLQIISTLLNKNSKDGEGSRTLQHTIPVIVHVMEFDGNNLITDAEVLDGIERLSNDFNSGNSTHIDFCPAQRSPQNTAVNGVNRIDCLSTYCGKYSWNGTVQTSGSETTVLKEMSTWLPLDYINIWVVNEIKGLNENTVGFATFPNTVSKNLGGIVIDYNYFNTGVLTHEIGHYLGLYHTFEDTKWGCINADDCANTGDKVCDTAPHLQEHRCSSAEKSNACCEDGCNGIGTDYDTYAYNFMSYSDVECLSKFTPGQTDRMRAHLETFYNSLTYSNGCNSACATVDLTLDGSLNVNANETYTYTNLTTGSSQSSWYFDNQLVGNDDNVEIVMETQGLHTLCLFTTVNDCPQDECINIYTLSDISSCNNTSNQICDLALNGDFESSVSLEDNVSYIKDAYHFSQYSKDWDLVCNWYNRTSSPLYCTENESGKFMLSINYDNLESIGTVKPLNLEIGKEYTVSIDYSVYSFNNVALEMDHFLVGLSHTVYKSNTVGNNTQLIKVNNPENEPALYESSEFCNYETTQTATATFTYSADMGQFLFIEGIDNNTRNRLIIDNISVVNCEAPTYQCELTEDALIFDEISTLSDYVSNEGFDNSFTNRTFYINSSLTIDLPITFSGCTFYFADNASLNIEETETPVTFSSSTLTACNDSWKGINIASDAKLDIKFGTLIEKAIIGINGSNGVEKLFVYRSELKNNQTAAAISKCDNTDSVVFDEISISSDVDNQVDGFNGIELAQNENFVYIRRSNFRNLQTAIYSDNANVEVKNGCTFENIGSKNSFDPQRSNIHSSAIVAENQSYISILEGNSFDCISGIALNQSTGNIANNTFKVNNEAIISAYDQTGLLKITNNSIVSVERGVDLTSVSNGTVHNNTITIGNDIDNNFGAGITLSNDIGGEVIGNLIQINTGKSGIVINNQTSVIIQDNILVNGEENKNNSTGINITGGAKHLVGCNSITSLTPSPKHIGISVAYSNTNDFIQNEFRNLVTGLVIKEMSDDQALQCNVFTSGNVGMEINSNIGKQGHHSNQWVQGGWSVADATSTLSSNEIRMMQFQVNGSSYPYTPSKVEANCEWFESNTELENTACSNCSETRTSISSEKNSFIESLCEQLTQEEEYSYVENFQLLKLIDANDLYASDETCIKAFIKEMESKAEQKYNTIGTLIKTTELSTLSKIKSANLRLVTALNQQNTSDIINLIAEVKQLQSLLTLDRTLQIFYAFAINSKVSATSEFAQMWKILHTHQLGLAETTILNLTDHQYNELSSIATECPAQVGQIVYIARDILSRITRVDYSHYDCIEDETTLEETSESNEEIAQENITDINTDEIDSTLLAINIYPNPASDYLNISFPIATKGVTVKVFSSHGILVHRILDTTHSSEMIGVSDWDAGIYMVQVLTGTEVMTRKVIVN